MNKYQRAVSWENQEGLFCSSIMWLLYQVQGSCCGAERGLAEERVVLSLGNQLFGTVQTRTYL